MNIRGVLVDMLPYTDPDVYGLYVTMDRKEIKKLITHGMNVIYRTMLASLLYYCKFCKTLKLDELSMNPYDSCAANRLVNALQQYIISLVGDCKLSHKDPKLNDSLIYLLCKKYQSIFEDGSSRMQVNLGKVKKITILDYIYEILYIFDKAYPTGGGTKSRAAKDIIFKANKHCKKLMANKLWIFITWWKKYFLLPSIPGQTPVPQFHSSL